MAWSASSNLRDRPVPGGRGSPQSLARISLAAFVFTFIAARLTVLLIMVGTQFFGLGLLGEFLAHDNQSDRRTNLVSVREAIGIELPDVATHA